MSSHVMLFLLREEVVGNSDQQLQGRHNVPQDNASKNNSVSMYVPIIPGKDSTRHSSSRTDEFIKSIESSRRKQ